MNKIQIELGDIDNTCFVVMPFSALFQNEYEKIIQPALEELHIYSVRADEIYTKQRIVDDIWVAIRKSRFVLAELSGKNPNVLYELGLAHAIGKPVIIITRNEDDVPFDLKALRYLFYNVDDPFWGENLKLGIQNLIKKILDSPTIENYLEDISQISEIKFPSISENVVFSNAKENETYLNVAGTWIGKFYDKYEEKRRHIKVTLQINQTKNELFGSSVSSYKIDGKPTVVQQMMNGTIQDNLIQLHGVNYTFVDRGNENAYFLDSYILELSTGKNYLKGVLSAEHASDEIFKAKIEFHKS